MLSCFWIFKLYPVFYCKNSTHIFMCVYVYIAFFICSYYFPWVNFSEWCYRNEDYKQHYDFDCVKPNLIVPFSEPWTALKANKAKKYSPSKKRFFNDKRFISVHFEDEILLGLPYAFRYHYRRKIKLLWKFFLCSSLQLYGDTDTKYFFRGSSRRASELLNLSAPWSPLV